MINLKFNELQKTKFIGSSYFIAVGLINLIDTLVNRNNYILRDFIILAILCLPLIINKRLFYLGFGLVTAPVTLVMLILFVFLQNPFKTDIYPQFFFFGCLIFTLGLLASLTLIHVGTYSKNKRRFRII